MRHSFSVASFISVAASLVVCGSAFAIDIPAGPSDYLTKITTLGPGDTLILAAGQYDDGLPVYSRVGTANAPITIRGPASGARAVFKGSNANNIIRVRSSAFVILQNLEVDGLNLDGFGVASDNGGSGCSHDITIENFYIHDLANDQQIVGISSTGCVSWNWVIRGNVIQNVGTGMYLGNSDGNQQFFGGLIEYNVFTDTIGYNMQIKHQNVRPTVTGMPTADARTIIRHNVFSKSGNSSTGGLARPNLLIGRMPPSGPGVNDRYEIYGNFFFQNGTEALFQGEGNVCFYDNVMFNSLGTAMRLQNQNGPPRDVHVFNNTIVALDTGISISGGASGFVQEAFGNAVFAGTAISASTTRDNVTGNMAAASTYLNNPTATIAQLDLFPKNAMLTGSTISYTSVTSAAAAASSTIGPVTDLMQDFNGTTQPGTLRGAYVYAGSATNPGWKLALSRKPTIGSPTPTPGPAPTVAFAASPTSIATGATSTLTWTSNGDSCVASGGWSGSKTTQGMMTVGPITATTTYTLTCTNSAGFTARDATVTFLPAPTVTLSANPTSVTSGGTTTLSWTTTNAQVCTASGGWSGSKAVPSGTEVSMALTSNATFSLACTGTGGAASNSANVTVTASVPTPTPTPTPTPSPPPDDSSGGGSLSLSFLLLLALRRFQLDHPRI